MSGRGLPHRHSPKSRRARPSRGQVARLALQVRRRRARSCPAVASCDGRHDSSTRTDGLTRLAHPADGRQAARCVDWVRQSLDRRQALQAFHLAPTSAVATRRNAYAINHEWGGILSAAMEPEEVLIGAERFRVAFRLGEYKFTASGDWQDPLTEVSRTMVA